MINRDIDLLVMDGLKVLHISDYDAQKRPEIKTITTPSGRVITKYGYEKYYINVTVESMSREEKNALYVVLKKRGSVYCAFFDSDTSEIGYGNFTVTSFSVPKIVISSHGKQYFDHISFALTESTGR